MYVLLGSTITQLFIIMYTLFLVFSNSTKQGVSFNDTVYYCAPLLMLMYCKFLLLCLLCMNVFM